MLGRERGVGVILFGLILSCISGVARGDDQYYVMIFGSQSRPKLLQYTHTWATFVRVVGDGADPDTAQARAASIVSLVFGVNSPRNWLYINASSSAHTSSAPTPAAVSGQVRALRSFTGIAIAATP